MNHARASMLVALVFGAISASLALITQIAVLGMTDAAILLAGSFLWGMIGLLVGAAVAAPRR